MGGKLGRSFTDGFLVVTEARQDVEYLSHSSGFDKATGWETCRQKQNFSVQADLSKCDLQRFLGFSLANR